MATAFTPQQIKGLKAKATDKRQEFRDAIGSNLFVVVQPKSGAVSFVVRPTTKEGKQVRKTLGRFPYMSLADARDRSHEIRKAAHSGELENSPGKSAITVQQAWDLYWEHEGGSRKSASEKKRIFDTDVAPEIGTRPLAQVTRHELSHLISGKFATAKTASNRLHSLLARFFKWCFTHGQALTHLEQNPMASVVKMHSERDSARRRYLNEEELRWWFKALPAAGEYRAIHELLLRTLCRLSEILHLTWGEVVERDNGDTVLELADTKNGEAHVVYLPPSAVKLLPKRPENAKPGDRVFRVVSKGSKPVDRLRKRMQELAAKEGKEVPHWQTHDYRRTGTSHLAGMMDADDNSLVPHHILDRLLAHKESGVIRHYNRYGYFKEKKSAVRFWNDYLDSLSP